MGRKDPWGDLSTPATLKTMFYFGWRGSAGLVCLTFSMRGYSWNFHFIVRRSHWQWWYVRSWYDGPLYSFGLGPFFLLAWHEEAWHEEFEDRPIVEFPPIKKQKKVKANWMEEGF